MSVTNPLYKKSYTGRGDTGPYAINFSVNLDAGGNASDILVQVQDSAGVITDITATSTITGMNVYTTASYDATNTVTLLRYPDLTQPYTFPYGTKFPSRTFESALDRLLFVIHRIAGNSDYAIKTPLADAAPPAELPGKNARKGHFLYFDVTNGDPIPADPASSVGISAFMQTVVDDLSAAAALTTLGIHTFWQAGLASADIKLLSALFEAPTILSTGSPYTLVAWSTEKLIITATTNPYIVNLPQATTCVGYRVKIMDGSALATGLVKIVPYTGDAIGSLAANTEVYLQNLDQSGAPYLFQYIELVATKAGYWDVVGGQFCPHQTVDTDGSQYHLGKFKHLPLGNTTARGTSFVPVAQGSWYGSPIQVTGSYGVPVGAKVVRLRFAVIPYVTAAGVFGLTICLSDNNGQTPTGTPTYMAFPTVGGNGYAAAAGGFQLPYTEVDVPLNSSGQFYAFSLVLTNVNQAQCVVGWAVVEWSMGD
jgi:hypothetical protein